MEQYVGQIMRILYVADKYDYGKPEQGFSFEHYNFFDSLHRMGHELLYFDIGPMRAAAERGRLNEKLLNVAKDQKPDLLFCVLSNEEIDPAVMRRISTFTTTINWFCDDHWRFDNFSSRWAPAFNWVVTTANSALSKYKAIGYSNVIKSQWACNHYIYRKLGLPLRYDVSFVGQPHGTRRAIIGALRTAGITVETWGQGWESGRLSQERMVEVLNSSRIDLNLSNASYAPPPPQGFARRAASKMIHAVPFGGAAMKAARRMQQRMITREAVPSAGPELSQQIKGRNFEVPGCGGFMLTGAADNLNEYYEINVDIAQFNDVPELINKIRYFLEHEDERKQIAENGYARTLAEHTYVHRFSEIFRILNLPHEPADSILARDVDPGPVVEVN